MQKNISHFYNVNLLSYDDSPLPQNLRNPLTANYTIMFLKRNEKTMNLTFKTEKCHIFHSHSFMYIIFNLDIKNLQYASFSLIKPKYKLVLFILC